MTDVQALLVAIAEGDLECVPVLADRLENEGDARAQGVREMVTAPLYRYTPGTMIGSVRRVTRDDKENARRKLPC
jgi:hypothetical protein